MKTLKMNQLSSVIRKRQIGDFKKNVIFPMYKNRSFKLGLNLANETFKPSFRKH
jgi:hypothetical protein